MTRIPRFMLAAPASGSGKTLITCGLLQAFAGRGKRAASFKCGPDYIDPMFHTKVLGTKSRNADSFLSSPETLIRRVAENGAGCDIAVFEGVMGYYDGLGGVSTRASAYEIAALTRTPVILIADVSGTSLSAAALIQGFLNFRRPSGIAGVILNRISPMLYPRMKEQLERETGVRVYGYLPRLPEAVFESRHLGLLRPEEISGFREKIEKLAAAMEESVELEELLALAESAPELIASREEQPGLMASREGQPGLMASCGRLPEAPLRIGVARDAAFCFFYEDNLELLRKMGAELAEFSPIADAHLPRDISGLLLNGGYPELYAERLSRNETMRREISAAVLGGLPVIAECGGFLYLQQTLEAADTKESYPMAGVFPGNGRNAGKLSRFGYVTLSGGRVFGEDIGKITAHEFHYYDVEDAGQAFLAEKPESTRSWRCIHSTDTILAGFPHFYYYGNPGIPEAFLKACRAYRDRERK